MGSWMLVVAVLFIFMVTGGPWALIRLVEGRRNFLLQMREQEARIAEAKAKELELEHKRAELEYREAVLELERFDRRTGRGKPPDTSPGAAEVDPPDPAS